MTVLLDTSFLIDLQREHRAAHQHWLRLIADGQNFLIPAPALVEFLAGANVPSEDAERVRGAAEVVELGEAEAIAAAGIARRALTEGKFIGWPDAQIAGIALHRGNVPIVTANPSHFPYSKTISYR